MNRAVFLDRDGVLNHPVLRGGKPYPPASVTAARVYDDAAEALAALKSLHFKLIGVSNQPDVARGTQTPEAVHKINEMITLSLSLDAFFVCFHDDADKCDCRKPLPGLLLRAARQYKVDLNMSYMIGDRWRDIEAGTAAGCTTILIDRNYHEKAPAEPPDYIVHSIREAAQAIILRESNVVLRGMKA